jgi:F-type H+-transporting ATPase subunit a
MTPAFVAEGFCLYCGKIYLKYMHISIAAEEMFRLGNFPMTNTFILTLIVSVGLVLFSAVFFGKLSVVPGRVQSAVEAIFEALWKLVVDVAGSESLARKFFPFIATIFFFVLFSNWSGLVPGFGTVGLSGHDGHSIIPFIRSPSADLNMTIAISLLAVFMVQFMGIATIGAVKYAKKFFVSPLVKPYGVGTFMGVLELMGEVTRVVSFSFRLFGNIFAGEVLLIVILNLVPYVVPLPFLFLEVFVGVVQAAVFSILTLVFLKMATLEPEHT